jgi:hypothetical protein
VYIIHVCRYVFREGAPGFEDIVNIYAGEKYGLYVRILTSRNGLVVLQKLILTGLEIVPVGILTGCGERG